MADSRDPLVRAHQLLRGQIHVLLPYEMLHLQRHEICSIEDHVLASSGAVSETPRRTPCLSYTPRESWCQPRSNHPARRNLRCSGKTIRPWWSSERRHPFRRALCVAHCPQILLLLSLHVNFPCFPSFTIFCHFLIHVSLFFISLPFVVSVSSGLRNSLISSSHLFFGLPVAL